jgi:hypothetical protein
MTRNNWSTSRATSFWIASAVFFLWRKHIRFGRAQLADLCVDLNQFLMQALQSPEFSDLSFGLSRCGLAGQGFGNSIAVELEGQAEIGTVAWILGLMAMAAEFATFASSGSDRSTPQIAPSRGLIGNVDALLFQKFQRPWGRHQGSLPP